GADVDGSPRLGDGAPPQVNPSKPGCKLRARRKIFSWRMGGRGWYPSGFPGPRGAAHLLEVRMKLGPRSLVCALAVILAASTLSVCGGKSPSQSATPTPPPTTAPPATQPTPPPTTCSRLGYVSPSNNCAAETPTFQAQVE